MYNLNTLFNEYPFKVEFFNTKNSSDFTCTVVMNTRTAQTETTVSNIKLMTIAPWTTLRYLRTLKFHISCPQICFDKSGYRTTLYKVNQDFHRQTQIG